MKARKHTAAETITVQEEWAALAPALSAWAEQLARLKKGEFEARRILDKIDRAIEFDDRGKFVETMQFHRDRFANAMKVIIGHNTEPKTADELQEAAIRAAYSAYVIGLFAEKPEDITKDVLSKEELKPEIIQPLISDRSRWNSKKSTITRIRKSVNWKNTLQKIYIGIEGKTLSLTQREIYERVICLWPPDEYRPENPRTLLNEISRLKRAR